MERFEQKPVLCPDFQNQHIWENYAKELDVEYRQSFEEGKDVEKYKALFDAVHDLPDDIYKNQLADVLFSLVRNAPEREGYPYVEPSDLDSILKARKPYPLDLRRPDDATLADKIKGAWYGRICGCLLGKPVEGMKSDVLEKILTRTGNYPMKRYIDREEITPEVTEGIGDYIAHSSYPRDLGKMPIDDDTNYMIVDYSILERYGRDFTAADVSRAWVELQKKGAYCTAERVAYRNFIDGFLPPASAEYKNPYREWIGAQIRADVYGYVNPCDPAAAAEMAFRDASISHVKNGIYGEMWVGAMLAAAFGEDDVEKVIRRGLAEIPASSRLYEAIGKIIAKYKSGVSCEECFADIHTRWDEYNGHDWCHTISNAEIVAACLLYGEKDYASSVGMAVQTGFDTDCNGATVGSVVGVLLGFEKLPKDFTDRLCDTLETSISGKERVSISEMAEKTMALIK